jgi:hypothetical protein
LIGPLGIAAIFCRDAGDDRSLRPGFDPLVDRVALIKGSDVHVACEFAQDGRATTAIGGL